MTFGFFVLLSPRGAERGAEKRPVFFVKPKFVLSTPPGVFAYGLVGSSLAASVLYCTYEIEVAKTTYRPTIEGTPCFAPRETLFCGSRTMLMKKQADRFHVGIGKTRNKKSAELTRSKNFGVAIFCRVAP